MLKLYCGKFKELDFKDRHLIVANVATVVASLIVAPSSIWISVVFSHQQKTMQAYQQNLTDTQWVTNMQEKQKEAAQAKVHKEFEMYKIYN